MIIIPIASCNWDFLWLLKVNFAQQIFYQAYRMIRKLSSFFVALVALSVSFISVQARAQDHSRTDTLPKHADSVVKPIDTVLRIKNLNPYFTLHVDSLLQYKMEVNKNPTDYYWYLRNSPVGVRIDKDNG